MTGDLSCLKNLIDIGACHVGMPNGAQTITAKEGTTCLGAAMKLEHVLFVPKLNFNMLSVSQLLGDTNYIVQFTKKFCVIQDCITRMLISAGEERGGLYYFKENNSATTCVAKGEANLDLWHK